MIELNSKGSCRGRELIQAPETEQMEAPLPIDTNVIADIFAFACQGSPRDFKNMTLVSKIWNQFINGDTFYRELHLRIAPEIFGRADFIKYIGGDPGEEFPIPFEYLIKFKSGRTLLTFAPKSLQFTQADGTVLEEPCTLQNMGKWASNAKGGHQVGYHPNNWEAVIQNDWPIEENHWSLIVTDLIEINKVFAAQQKAVGDRGEELVGLSDFSLSVLMSAVKTGVRCIMTDIENPWVRVPEKMSLPYCPNGAGMCVLAAADGLLIRCIPHIAQDYIGVVVAQKAFGH